jgi:hypothetical protein
MPSHRLENHEATISADIWRKQSKSALDKSALDKSALDRVAAMTIVS